MTCLLTQVELDSGLPSGHIGIEAQIETARGLLNVEEICAASPRLEAVVFGPVDFAASMEMPVLTGGVQIDDYPGDHFNYVFSKILMAGRANGLQVIDGPFLKIHEPELLRDYCNRAAFPRLRRQVGDRIPTRSRLERGLLAYPGTVRPGVGDPRRLRAGVRGRAAEGAVMFGDEMIDEASRKMALKFVVTGTSGRSSTLRSGPVLRPPGERQVAGTVCDA